MIAASLVVLMLACVGITFASVALVFNAVFSRFMPHTLWWQAAGMVLAWWACNAAGAAFHDRVELRLTRRR